MPLDRKSFFDRVRAEPFGGALSVDQVQGLTRILDEAERRGIGDPRHLAYRLATTFHETGRAMVPVRENGSESYLRRKPYWPWVGEGLVQVTWEANARKFGASKPGDCMSWPVALRALFDGMDEGTFTGRRLSTYFSDAADDPVNARRIINGLDCAEKVAGYHRAFLVALSAATPTLDVVAVDKTKPVLASIETAINRAAAAQGKAPIAVSAAVPTAAPAHIDTVRPAPKPGFWGALVAALTPKTKTEA